MVVGRWWLVVSSRTLVSASSGGGGVGGRDVGSVDDGVGGASGGGGAAGGGAGRTVQAICPANFGTFPSSLASSSISLAICSLGPRSPTQRRLCSDVPVGRTSQHLGFGTPRRRGLNATAGLLRPRCHLSAAGSALSLARPCTLDRRGRRCGGCGRSDQGVSGRWAGPGMYQLLNMSRYIGTLTRRTRHCLIALSRTGRVSSDCAGDRVALHVHNADSF